jgi:glucan phosphoethanolaminetransferase (alkaline phosphatase superfamily)
MDGLIAYLSSHHIALALAIAAAVLIAYFIFKRLIKLALFCFLVALGVAGYFYLKQPGRTWKDVSQALQKTKTQTEKVVETGKKTYEKGKEVYEKGKKFSDSVDSLIGKDKEKRPEAE